MKNNKLVLKGIVLGIVLGFAVNASAASVSTTITEVGPLSATPTSPTPMLQINSTFLPDAFSFDLGAKSDVTVNYTSYSNVPAGPSFSLFSSTNLATALYSVLLPAVTSGSSLNLSFAGLDAGNYLLKYSPNGSTGIYTSTLSFSAVALPVISTPVPEASTNSLMLCGLGLMAFMARRKSKQLDM